jgi:hypothetical protein
MGLGGWWKVAVVSAVFRRGEIGEIPILHKKEATKRNNKEPRQ